MSPATQSRSVRKRGITLNLSCCATQRGRVLLRLKWHHPTDGTPGGLACVHVAGCPQGREHPHASESCRCRVHRLPSDTRCGLHLPETRREVPWTLSQQPRT